MNRRVLLLGCGAQGAAVLHDLAPRGDDPVHVVVVDRVQGAGTDTRGHAESRVVAVTVDATDEAAVAALFESGRHHMVDVPELGVPLECYANGDAVIRPMRWIVVSRWCRSRQWLASQPSLRRVRGRKVENDRA